MTEPKTSLLANGLIWFGAAVSIAEIFTGTLLAPLGFSQGVTAILLGHVIGCTLFFLAGVIGGKTGLSSMETVKLAFGQKGSLIFSLSNVLQLIGWTAVMIISGAMAAEAIIPLGGTTTWSILIGLLIILWLYIGIRNLSKLNALAMVALFVLTIVLSRLIFAGSVPLVEADATALSFGAAVELSVAMPLSWLPLISDYTRTAKNPVAGAAVSTIVYGVISCWMYIIGLGAAIFTGESDIAALMLKAGLGMAALAIVVVSTVTTTYLDAYSAGISTLSITGALSEKQASILWCIVGTLLAIFTPITQYEDFLFLIGSVFAPMVAILLTSYYVLHINAAQRMVEPTNLILWVAGFVLYRNFMTLDTPLGSTFPVMLIISVVCFVVHKVKGTAKAA